MRLNYRGMYALSCCLWQIRSAVFLLIQWTDFQINTLNQARQFKHCSLSLRQTQTTFDTLQYLHHPERIRRTQIVIIINWELGRKLYSENL